MVKSEFSKSHHLFHQKSVSNAILNNRLLINNNFKIKYLILTVELYEK